MPCTHEETPEEKQQRFDAMKESLIKPWREKLNKTTEMLCHVLTVLEEAESYKTPASRIDYIQHNIRVEVRSWFRQHKEADRRRKEELITSAKSKLNDDELEALGLKKD